MEESADECATSSSNSNGKNLESALDSANEDSQSADADSKDYDDETEIENTLLCCADDKRVDSEEDDEQYLSEADHDLFITVQLSYPFGVQKAIQDGANVNCVRVRYFDEDLGCYLDYYDEECGASPLIEACKHGNDDIVGMLLDAGVNAQYRDDLNGGWSALLEACSGVHLSTVQTLLDHDDGLLEIADDEGYTPLMWAIQNQRSRIVRFLMDRGANIFATDQDGRTTLMWACCVGNLEIVRLLLAAGVELEARDGFQDTALHLGVEVSENSELLRELVLHHNANMFAVNKYGRTPFDRACSWYGRPCVISASLIEVYGNKMAQEEGRLALHAILGATDYSFAPYKGFHPPLSPFRVCLQMGTLTHTQFRTLLHSLDTELIRNRDDSGKLPIHIACETNAPVEVLAMLVEIDPATLQIADHSGALPIHLLCCSGTPTEYARVRYLVEQGGVGTLAARSHVGALPLHVFCGSIQPKLRVVQYLIQSFPGAVTARTNAGHYAFMLAACESSSASLCVVYEIARAHPSLIIPNN